MGTAQIRNCEGSFCWPRQGPRHWGLSPLWGEAFEKVPNNIYSSHILFLIFHQKSHINQIDWAAKLMSPAGIFYLKTFEEHFEVTSWPLKHCGASGLKTSFPDAHEPYWSQTAEFTVGIGSCWNNLHPCWRLTWANQGLKMLLQE